MSPPCKPQSLTKLCLLAIRNGIEDGSILNANQLPVKWRQDVLDLILMHGTINQPTCYSTLGTVDFLRGLNTLSTRQGNVDDGKYLRRVAESLRFASPKEIRLGETITTLHLNLYGWYLQSPKPARTVTSQEDVVHLIAQCPNLTSLEILATPSEDILKRCVSEGEDCYISSRSWTTPAFLSQTEELQGCIPVLENLTELSFMVAGCADGFFLNDLHPLIEFKRLSKLTLIRFDFQPHMWAKVLEFLRETLTYLRIENACDMSSRQRCVRMNRLLPFSLPRLKTLKVDSYKGRAWYQWNRESVDTLAECSNLQYVGLSLHQQSGHPATLGRLALNEHIRDASVEVWWNGSEEDDYLDSSSRFLSTSLFADRISTFDLAVCNWTPRLTTAFEHALASCKNLVNLRLCFHDLPVGPDFVKYKAALSAYFGKKDRAMRLRQLHLEGDLDSEVLALALKNCLSIDSLELHECPQLRDSHLIDWLSCGGGQLTVFGLHGCHSLTDSGIIPILVKSGEQLRKFRFTCRGDTEPSGDIERLITDETWRTLLDHCPYVEEIDGIPDHFGEMIKAKCYGNLCMDLSYTGGYRRATNRP